MRVHLPLEERMRKALLTCIALVMLTACSSSEDEWYYYQSGTVVTSLDDINTGLPKVDITTPGKTEVVSKEVWTEGAKMTIYLADGSIDYQGTLSIRGRGNFTMQLPKRPFALKLDKKSPVLGMPKHKRWCLLANWLDRTMMRNAVAFEIAAQMPALDYTPRGRFVEVFFNGRHLGNYYLCEQIKIDENRVDITEAGANVTTGPAVTGGYLFELDDYFDEPHRFMSERAGMPWQIKEPDELSQVQVDYAKHYVAELENALYDNDRFRRRDFAEYMDLNSFVDWWLVHELTMNTEVRHPRSCYMYKDIDPPGGIAKLKAGPVWDFDLWTFNADLTNQFTSFNSLYYLQLFQDQGFRQLVKDRWARVKEAGLLQHTCDFIDLTEQQLALSDQLNAKMWPITRPMNADTFLSFHDAAQKLKTAFIRKYTWLDNAINQL